jgi:hypothetical protein
MKLGTALAVAGLVMALYAGSTPAEGAGVGASGLPPVFHRPLCAPVPTGRARCLSDVVTDSAGDVLAAATPSGYGPGELRSAYGLEVAAGTRGAGHTIAVVVAHDNPTAETDLAVYRNQYGLPPCTTANGCFTKRDQNGGVLYPLPDQGWGGEIALDLAMASAICPNCRLLLVEASSTLLSDLAAATSQAAALGATEVTHSYGASEWPGELQFEGSYNRPGVAMTASAGDQGYGVEFPAASRYITAVGGTTLRTSATARGWTETAWSGTGSGCSAYVPKPPWQSDAGCPNRTVADVSADADPGTGVAVFHTDGSNPSASGWMVFGGTSVAAPIVAGIYALRGHGTPTDPFRDLAPFADVTSGANGSCGNYLCQAGPGFDGPTGIGTPYGGNTAPSQPPPAGRVQPPAPESGSKSPASSAVALPTLTMRRAALYARRTMRMRFGRRFTGSRGFTISCRRRSRISATCQVSWRYGPSDYWGSVVIRYTRRSTGGVAWRGAYTIRQAGRGCRAARPRQHCRVKTYRSA